MLAKIAIVVLLFSATAPAFGQTNLQRPACSAASISVLEEKLAGMQDSRQKATAASEVASAKERLDKGEMDECQEHLLKATVQMK